MESTTNEAPTLLTERTGDGHEVRAWCPWCRLPNKRKRGRWHYHGDAGRTGDLGHRAAHCFMDSGSPYLATGYRLLIVAEAPPGRVRDDG